uniref:Cytochrome b n=1 Tax=Afrocampsis griseosetosus TaxID=1491719 RepID=A0A0U1WH40_9HYME|nr:cytochrome b [Afrocampsis griseosetosus]
MKVNKSLFKVNILLKMISMVVIKLPISVNISVWWNFGSLLGLFLVIQFISGVLLSMHYISSIQHSFLSVTHIMQDVNNGWGVRLMHMNGASMFFICVYCHIGRGIYYSSYKLLQTWIVGVMIFIVMMGTAFMGYVLPWGQMSFWGATVITNLLSALPYIGELLVEWLWGGYSVGGPTLNRFYTFHFLMPFILLMLVVIHLMYLHKSGSNNPIGLDSNYYKVNFHNYFTLKDLLGFLILGGVFSFIILEYPYIMGDPENFLVANSMVTPIHIQPEWYFLFAYTILRSIPNKLSGVVALLMSILILFFLPLKMSGFQSMKFYPLSQMFYWIFTYNVLMLTWLGGCPVEYPFMHLSQGATVTYFLYFFTDFFFKDCWDKIG